jgi:hypothetical protein
MRRVDKPLLWEAFKEAGALPVEVPLEIESCEIHATTRKLKGDWKYECVNEPGPFFQMSLWERLDKWRRRYFRPWF